MKSSLKKIVLGVNWPWYYSFLSSYTFVSFLYIYLISPVLQRLYTDFHREAPADLVARLASLEARRNQVRIYICPNLISNRYVHRKLHVIYSTCFL